MNGIELLVDCAHQLQAAVAGVHDEAARAEDTDWPQILALYELLKRMSANLMVTLNHAIAAAMVHGPSTGLELLKALDADEPATIVSTQLPIPAPTIIWVRAHLLEMAGDHEAAIIAAPNVRKPWTTSNVDNPLRVMQSSSIRTPACCLLFDILL